MGLDNARAEARHARRVIEIPSPCCILAQFNSGLCGGYHPPAVGVSVDPRRINP